MSLEILHYIWRMYYKQIMNGKLREMKNVEWKYKEYVCLCVFVCVYKCVNMYGCPFVCKGVFIFIVDGGLACFPIWASVWKTLSILMTWFPYMISLICLLIWSWPWTFIAWLLMIKLQNIAMYWFSITGVIPLIGIDRWIFLNCLLWWFDCWLLNT